MECGWSDGRTEITINIVVLQSQIKRFNSYLIKTLMSLQQLPVADYRWRRTLLPQIEGILSK